MKILNELWIINPKAETERCDMHNKLEWISVDINLPKRDVEVLAIHKDSQKIYMGYFTACEQWNEKNGERINYKKTITFHVSLYYIKHDSNQTEDCNDCDDHEIELRQMNFDKSQISFWMPLPVASK